MSKGEEIKGFRQEETSRAPSKPPEDTGSGGQASPRPGSYSPPLTDGKAEAQGVEGGRHGSGWTRAQTLTVRGTECGFGSSRVSPPQLGVFGWCRHSITECSTLGLKDGPK